MSLEHPTEGEVAGAAVRLKGPLSEDCIERIKTDIEGITHISGTGPDLSAAWVVAVREGMRR